MVSPSPRPSTDTVASCNRERWTCKVDWPQGSFRVSIAKGGSWGVTSTSSSPPGIMAVATTLLHPIGSRHIRCTTRIVPGKRAYISLHALLGLLREGGGSLSADTRSWGTSGEHTAVGAVSVQLDSPTSHARDMGGIIRVTLKNYFAKLGVNSLAQSTSVAHSPMSPFIIFHGSIPRATGAPHDIELRLHSRPSRRVLHALEPYLMASNPPLPSTTGLWMLHCITSDSPASKTVQAARHDPFGSASTLRHLVLRTAPRN